MELLRTLGIDWRLLMWQIVNFLIVLFILKKYAFGPITDALAKRTAKLEQGLRDAVTAKRNLSLSVEEKEVILKDARQEAGRILNEAREQSESLRNEMMIKAKTDVEQIVSQGKNRLITEKEAMLSSAKSEIGALVVAATEKILPRILSTKDHELLVSEAATALKGKV